jgi:hypothetical protein
LLGFSFIVANFFIKVHVARQASRCFARLKQNNAMELLLSTPLTVDQIIDGQWKALQHYFVRPIVITFTVEVVGLVAVVLAAMISGDLKKEEAMGAITAAGGITWVYAMYYIFDAFGVAWAGLWFGLSAKSESAAINRTVLLAIALPTFSMGLCYIGLPVLIGAPLFWIAWGSSKVRAEFRRIAAQQYAPPQTGWFPGG